MLGLSAIPTSHPLNKGMLGMHGTLGPNVKTNECDVLIAVGMRFDDRVTCLLYTSNRNSSVGFSFGSRGAGWQIGSDKTL